MSVTLNKVTLSGSTRAGQYIPNPPIIPAGTIILFDGATPSISGWTNYSAATGRYIKGTTTEANIGSVVNRSGNVSGTIEFATAGAHMSIGSTFKSTWIAYPGTFGSSQALTSGPAGGHTHTATVATESVANVLPWTSDITFLLATTNQQTFPANTIHIRDIADTGWTQKLATNPGSPTFNTIRNIRGSPGATAPTETSLVSATLTSTSSSVDGTHSHFVNDTGYVNPATGTSLGGSSYLPPSPSFTGSAPTSPSAQAHAHTVTPDFAVKNLQSRALKLWVAAQASGLLSNTIVMYSGSLTSLPSYWKVCDGTNGTIDMSNVYLSHSSSSGTSHGSPFNRTANLTGTTSTESWTHNHGYSTGGAPSGGYATKDYYHTSGSQPHSHDYASAPSMTETYVANTIELAFIQYVAEVIT